MTGQINKLKIGVAGLMLACVGQGVSASSETDRPNFLIILADDLAYGDLSCYGGYAPTPRLDELFRSGLVMQNFEVTPLCSPTRAGLLTGCNPLPLDQGPYVDAVLDPAIPTFGSAFQKQGYKTGIFGKWHNSQAPFYDPSMTFVNDYGFDEWLGGYGGGFDLITKVWPGALDTPCWYHNRTHITNDMSYATDELTDYAIRFMDANRNGDFVCYLPYMAMHEPYIIKEEDLKKVPKKLIREAGGLRPWKEYYKYITAHDFGGRLYEGYVNVTGDHSMDSLDVELSDAEMKILYAAMLINLDENVGRLLDYLEESGQEDNTVVWFLSDNGGIPRSWVGNHPIRGWKATCWEGGSLTRAVVRWPAVGWEKFKTYDGLIRAWDLYPTCMDMAGLPVPEDIDGRSCFAAMQSGESSPVDAYYYVWEDCDLVRTERWKLVRFGDHSELYDLKRDPNETTDVAGRHPEMEQTLTEKLNDWVRKNEIKAGTVPHQSMEPSVTQDHPKPLNVQFEQTESCSRKQERVTLLKFPRVRIETGDLLEYDIRFDEKSMTDGGWVTLLRGTQRPLVFRLTVDQFGRFISEDYSYEDAKGKWAHRVIGIGQGCPEWSNHIQFGTSADSPGSWKFSLDNVVIRRRDGTRIVLWESGMPIKGSSAPERISDLSVTSN